MPNLDPLRFFAAAIVSFYHTDMMLVSNHLKKDYYYFFPFQHGDIAVIFFFVLSGFLITFLLLNEKDQTGKISVKKFYLKRIFRIWPLYFLMIGLSIGYFNTSDFFQHQAIPNYTKLYEHIGLYALLFLLIAPNMVTLGVPSIGYANPTWSIGVEEQFYLIWPWIIRGKHALRNICIIIICVFLLTNGLSGRILGALTAHHVLQTGSLPASILFYVDQFFTSGYSFRIDAMAIGAIGSYVLVRSPGLLTIIYGKAFQFFLYVILFVLLLFPHFVVYQFYALVFILIILNLCGNRMTIVTIKSKVLNYLGKISYGIYMFHLIAMVPSMLFVTAVLKLPINFYTEILTCLISLGITILIASFSFYSFERFFFILRDRLIKDLKTPKF